MSGFELLLLGFLVLMATGGCARGCRTGWRRHSLRAGRRHELSEAEPVRGELRGGEGASAERPRAETELEALQRRYVEGRLTLEEYEQELDRTKAFDAS